MTKLQSAVRTYEVDINGAEETFHLALNYAAMTALCDEWKIDINALDTALDKLDPTKVPDVIYAAMKGYDPDATKERSVKFCRALSVPDLIRVCHELISGAQPASEDGAKGPRARPGSTA